MNEQSTALLLADALTKYADHEDSAEYQAAAELRRLHAANQEMLKALEFIAGHDLSNTSDRAKALIADFVVHRAKVAIAKHGEQQ